jgi:hypothetical protein
MTPKKNADHLAMRYATALVSRGIVIALALISPSGMAQGTSSVAPSSSQYVKGSLCTQPDQVVFSCPLAKNGKIVSVCAAGNASPHQFYYAFGRPNAVEMRFPDNASESKNGFFHSFPRYADGTGAYAYSFVRNEIKYIVYYLSGKYGDTDGGVIVQKSGSRFAMADMECHEGKIIEASDSSLLNETTKWKVDNDVDGRPLPPTK